MFLKLLFAASFCVLYIYICIDTYIYIYIYINETLNEAAKGNFKNILIQ